MLGRGRPSQRPSILGVSDLTRGEVAEISRGAKPAVKVFRDSHHMVARLFAVGLRPGEVSARSGYSLNRISTLYGSPAFKELIAQYRDSVNDGWKESVDEYFDLVTANRTISARLLNDKLSVAEPDDLSVRELVAIHADSADRSGYPKRSVAVNVNLDFAAKLDAAIQRSDKARVIEHVPSPSPSPSPDNPAPIRRLA